MRLYSENVAFTFGKDQKKLIVRKEEESTEFNSFSFEEIFQSFLNFFHIFIMSSEVY